MEKNEQKGITLIALVITIIVLVILTGVSIMMISGQDGILSKTADASVQNDISSTKEKIKLELIGKYNNNGQYTNEDVADAVWKVTGEKIELGTKFAVSKKGNLVDISDLWKGLANISIICEEEETESRATALKVYAKTDEYPSYEEYAREIIDNMEDGQEMIDIFVDGYNFVTDATSSWKDIAGKEYTTVNEYFESAKSGIYGDQFKGYESYKDFMIQKKYVKPKEYLEKYKITVTCNGESQDIDPIRGNGFAEFPIVENKEYDVIASLKNGKSLTVKTAVTKCKTETFSSICDTNTEITSDGYIVTVPAGFAYGTSDNVKSVNGGLVITDSVDSNGNSTGNEFVWIPVDKTNLTVGNTDKKMAKISSGSDYEGVLYWFSGTSSTEMSNYGLGTTSWREPAVVSKYDGTGFDPVGITKSNLQKEYNDMIASIKKYRGFYVARYEAGIENGKVTSKIGVTPTSAKNDKSKTWYGLYSLAKTYTNSKNSVTSQMIWGSQYDAMLNFALTGNDKSKVESTEYGNYSGTVLRSGLTRTSDKINNIYDLGGNLEEWTSEAFNTRNRARRGGVYDSSCPATFRTDLAPNFGFPHISSRPSIYVN